MDKQTREKLEKTINQWLQAVGVHGVRFGTHTMTGEAVKGEREVALAAIMAAIDEGIADPWVRITPATMPPQQEPIVVRWHTGYDICRVIGTEWWTETGARFTPYTLPPTHWMLLPPAPPKEPA